MKQIAIIGASSGLGMRVAEIFAQSGWKVAVAARREEPLRKLQQRFPDNVVYHTVDVTANDAVERFYHLLELNNGADIILLASGVGFSNPHLELQKEVNILETNVVGFTRIMTAAYKYFRDTRNESTPGRIAAITSIAGTKGAGAMAAYSASKRYQRTYIDALEQLARRQVVNVEFTDIRPGFIRTALLDAAKKYPMEMNVDNAAMQIVYAILKGKRVATIDWRWRIVAGLWSLLPQRLWKNIPIDF